MRSRIVYGPRGEKRFFVGGVEVTRAEFDARFPNRIADLLKQKPPAVQQKAGWPIASESFSVLPEQIPEAMQADRELGVSADYDRDGRPIFTDQTHQNAFLKAHGWRNRDRFY